MANPSNHAPRSHSNAPQAQNRPAPKVIKKKTQTKRSFSGKVAGLTDLFKLTIAKVIKHDSGATEGAHPEYQPNEFTQYEHTHPYRTFDKAGKACDYCVPIGGHFHIVKTEAGDTPDEPMRVIDVSPPMVMGTRTEKGRKVQIPVPANNYDFHTHEAEYVRSCKFETSSTNFEAAAVVAFDAQKTAPVAGVVTE